MFQKIINFIKYHNAFTIGLVLTLIVGGAALANEDVRDTIIGEEIITEQGIDNSQVLAIDLDNFDFAMQITDVLEDAENYYVDYIYNTLAIKDNAWQEVARTGTLTVSKSGLAGQDLGLYVAEELGEIIDSQLSYLREVQEIEMERGQTFVQQTVKHTALLGLILDPETHELPGYEPVVQRPEIVVAQPGLQPETFVEPLVLCVPDWQCDAWQPSIDTVLSGQEFTQTRVCNDLNNCGIEQDKPIGQQMAIGLLQSPTLTPEPTPDPASDPAPAEPVCSSEHLDLCATQELCEGVNLYWYNEICNTEPETLAQEVCSATHLNLCLTQADCETAAGFWYNDICNTEPEAPAECVPAEEICDGLDNDCDGQIDENVDCGITSCDGSLNLAGECQNSCLGAEGCGACVPSCVCVSGWNDCDANLSNGCEIEGECVKEEPEPEPTPEPEPEPEEEGGE